MLATAIPAGAQLTGPGPATPDTVRGLYINAFAAGSTRRLGQLIELTRGTDINAFVIDVKEVGEISYASSVPLARVVGASRAYIRKPRAVLERLHAAGIHPIARIVVFRDTVLARARPDLSVRTAGDSVWVDAHGLPWVDSYNREVWDYNIAIAREAIALGFREIQWDYVRFPDAPARFLTRAVWPAQDRRSKKEGIRQFLLYAREQLADLNVPMTADVFGLTVSVHGDMNIGQDWESMSDAVDVLLPMVYPSHFADSTYGLPDPNAEPYRVVLRAMQDAVARSDSIANAAEIRPWLQAFTLGNPRYGADEIAAQVRAVYDAGLEDWLLWNPGSRYAAEALAAASRVDDPPALPRETVALPRRVR